ncbi:MAG: helix-turn-helix transcriptional regulator [Candidatus Margulisiibacteriota bacterium]|jgi:transcriptional regulator with XRE-family HTH domain
MNKAFGELIQKLRKEKGWTIKDFIEKLGSDLSPTYITKIEVYGEIPSPEVICKIADVFNFDEKELLERAKQNKVERFEKSLEEKYQKASGLYRTQKGNTN